jgi:hypothetical protein
MSTPTWYTPPEQQLQRAYRLWRRTALPEPPRSFRPRTSTEVLLLHVPYSFDNLWKKVVAPRGYRKSWSHGFKTDSAHLRRAPRVPYRANPVWLGFDPEHGKGRLFDSLWGRPNLAASEVLSALIQFPDWPLAWFDGVSAPNLAGYQLKFNGAWLRVPCLARLDDDRLLLLSAVWAGYTYAADWSNPSVREC